MSGRMVAIAGLGIASALGNDLPELAASYADGARPFRRDPCLVGVDGLPMTICPAMPLSTPGKYANRLASLLATALAGMGRLDLAIPIRITLPAWLGGHPSESALIAVLADAVGRRAAPPTVGFGGPAEALSAIGHAASEIMRGTIDAVVIGAVDSLLHPEILDRLAMQNRVLSRDNPYGAVPAEAACLIHLCCAGPDLAELGQLLAVFRGREPEDVAQPTGIIGQGLATAYRQAVEYVAADRMLSDMNGERWRAEEFGFAVSAAGGNFPELSDRVEVPALHLGDCGSAAGPLMVALALCDPPSRTHPLAGPVALVSASSREGMRAAMVVERHAGSVA